MTNPFNKPWRIVAALLLVLALAALAWKLHGPARPAAPEVTTAPVTRGDIELGVLATGTIEAAKLVSVGAQASGVIVKLHVALGDSVKQGDLIAEIDPQPQRNALRNAEAGLASVRAQRAAKVALLKQAELATARLRGLVAADAGTQADLEAAVATEATTRADIAALDAQIAQALVTADTARVNLGYTRVLAPMDGVIVAIVTEQGQTVNAVQAAPTIVKLARLDLMTVKAQISEADVARVKPGLPVYFSLLGDPDRRWDAKLRAVEPGPTTIATDSAATTTSSSTATAIYYNGIFDVPNPDHRLRISMTAQTTIVLDRARHALLIPAAALGPRDAQGRYAVRVQGAGGAIAARSVSIGLNNRVQAQVLSGLGEGERVVTGQADGAAAGPRNGPPMMF